MSRAGIAVSEFAILVGGIAHRDIGGRDNDWEAGDKALYRRRHVRWNSEAGHVSGKITKVITSEVEFKGYKVHASRDEPQYEIFCSCSI